MSPAPPPGGKFEPLEAGRGRIGLLARPQSNGLDQALAAVTDFAGEHGLTLVPDPELASRPVASRLGLPSPGVPLVEAGAELDLLVTLGGDGTLLRGARAVRTAGVPVLGINLGHLGFLTALGAEEVEDGLQALLEGRARLDTRFTLEGRVIHADGRPGARLDALNDLVLHKGGVARVVRLGLFTGRDGDRDEIGRFSGDGVIVATPTGSTAYSLSAGGPVVAPSMECLVVTPISAHTLAMRPLVLPFDETLTIEALDRVEELVVTADGQTGIELAPGDRVRVGRGNTPVRLVRFPGQSFFGTLRRKLNWAV
ncbi:MAG: NAD(+)/NADH kinase [Gemmatimonadales bacterium]|nr:MAG: NAD(+)/NADH kinase [Gemmatimonadales bacterium]